MGWVAWDRMGKLHVRSTARGSANRGIGNARADIYLGNWDRVRRFAWNGEKVMTA